MKATRPRLRQQLGFFLSSWLVFLLVAFMVFANAGMFDRSFGEDAGSYVGFVVMAAAVGGFLWRVAGQYARDDKL